MSPNELQQAIEIAKAHRAQGKITVREPVFQAPTKRAAQKTTPEEYKRIVEQGLTVIGKPRVRRPYAPKEDLKGWTPDQRKARIRKQQREYCQRIKKEQAAELARLQEAQIRIPPMKKFAVKFAHAVFCPGVDKWYLRFGENHGVDVMFWERDGKIAKLDAELINRSLNAQLNKRYYRPAFPDSKPTTDKSNA